MTIGFASTLQGTGSTVADQTSLSYAPIFTIAAGQLVVVAVACDNIASGGDDGAVTGVTITQTSKIPTTLTKATQVANNVAAQGGVSLSVWYGKSADAYSSGPTITATFGSATLIDASAMAAYQFATTAGNTVIVETMATPDVNNTAALLGSMNLSGLPAVNRLRFRASGVQTSIGSSSLTASSGFTQFLPQQSASSGGTTEVAVVGEFAVNTSASGISSPAWAPANINAINVGVFISFQDIGPTGDLAVTEGPDIVAINAVSTAFTTLAVTEGPDTVVFNARSTAFAALAVTEGADAIIFNVAGVGGPNNSNLVVTEGPDTVVIAADFSYSIALDAVEDGDTVFFELTGVDPSPPPIVHEVLRFGRPTGRW